MGHPLLDVSDVLDDPDFLDTTLRLKPTAITVGNDGLAEGTAGWIAFAGVVIPDGGTDLIQLGEGDEVQGDITIYTRQPLTTGDADRGADTVFWDGAPYVVINAQPWRYGSGYFRAVCKLATLNPSQVPQIDAGFLG